MSHPAVICGTCGRDNAPNLVFCQDCGARLGPRVAPPTPAIGVNSHVAASANEPPLDAFPMPEEGRESHTPPVDDIDALLASDGQQSEPPRESRSRPSAPNFDFAPREQQKAEEEPTRNRCGRCGIANAQHIRYCLSCGNTLRASIAPVSLPSPQLSSTAALSPPDSRAAPRDAVAAADQPIAPIPVVGVGNVAPSTSTIRVCARCRGVCDSTAQFCKFCGASLLDVAVSSHPIVVTADTAREAPHSAPRPPRIEIAKAETAMPPISRRDEPITVKGRGRLIVIAKDGGEGASYPFHERLDIGRVEGDVVVPDDPYISPRHARLSWKGKLLLRDLGSVNGVYLRLAQKEPAKGARKDSKAEPKAEMGASIALKLQDQDLILLGQQVIRFEVVRDAEEGLGPASQHGTLVFGTPTAPRYARLCLRTVEGVTRDVYYLGKRETILGRESGDIIFAEDPFLSRRHASIVVHESKETKKRTFALSDFGSSNGTFLQIRGEVPLESGDEFRVGQQLFRVELTA